MQGLQLSGHIYNAGALMSCLIAGVVDITENAFFCQTVREGLFCFTGGGVWQVGLMVPYRMPPFLTFVLISL